MMGALTGEVGREAVESYEATNDESKIRDLLERLIEDAMETTPDPEDWVSRTGDAASSSAPLPLTHPTIAADGSVETCIRRGDQLEVAL